MSYKRNDTPEMKAACINCGRADCDGECDLIQEMRRGQSNNGRPARRMYTIDGRTQGITEWCNEYGIPYSTVWYRFTRLGMPLEDALKPGRIHRSGRKGEKVTIDGESYTVSEWSKRLYVHKTTIYQYAKRANCDLETAVRHYMTRG